MTRTVQPLARLLPIFQRGVRLAGTLGVTMFLTSMGPVARAEEAPTAPASDASFEDLRRAASPIGDLASGLRPPESVESCDKESGDRARARCRVVRRFLLKNLPRHPFRKISDDPDAVTLSDFDGTIKGYHLAVAGCLACRRPLPVGSAGEPRLVTLGAPDKSQKGALKDAVSISRNAVSFGSLAEAKKWLAGNKPALRAEFVFLPVQEPWNRGSEQGVSLTKVGVRVFNRCTGEVIVSQPPSRRAVDVDRSASGCAGLAGATTDKDATGNGEPVRQRLSRSDIADAMEKVRAPVNACYGQFHQPGRVDLSFVVAPSGLVQAVTAQGPFQGTPTGECAINAAKLAKFPAFDGSNEEFVYLFFLR